MRLRISESPDSRLSETCNSESMAQKLAFTNKTVVNEGVAIATRDYGGAGSRLVMMHGAGGSQASTNKVVALLLGSHRVVSFDFRGHGESGVGPWSFTTAV